MARIRSIKPEFFTSERIATLPLSARLTFIGLWLYVDDNGVGLDNERLILAAIWPLEEDVIGTLQRTREDLVRLSRDSLIVRYRDDVKRYIAVRSWEEHQRVQHPGKPRYPRPGAAGVTCENSHPPESLPKSSGDLQETLAPEQGAGSREQGAGNTTAEVINSNVEVTGRAPPNGQFDYFAMPPARPGEEAERKRQLDALAAMIRDTPEATP